MPATEMPELFGRAARGLVDAQLLLDERGRDSFDAFDDTGVPPTVLTWSTVHLSLTAALGVRGKQAAGERTSMAATSGGAARISLTLRYLHSPQGGDDPTPALPAPTGSTNVDPDTG
jgi:hypothetical protein